MDYKLDLKEIWENEKVIGYFTKGHFKKAEFKKHVEEKMGQELGHDRIIRSHAKYTPCRVRKQTALTKCKPGTKSTFPITITYIDLTFHKLNE